MNDDAKALKAGNVIPIHARNREGTPVEVTPERLLRIKMRMTELSLDQSALSVATGLSNSAISQLLKQKFKNTRHFPALAKALSVNLSWLLAATDQRVDLSDWQGEAVSEDELPQLLEVKEFAQEKVDTISTEGIARDRFDRNGECITLHEIDMTLSAKKQVDGIPVKASGFNFGQDVLGTYARSNPASLMVATGIGHAMQPMLVDSDLLFIDTAQQTADGADKMWAFAYAGAGMVRRLRATSGGVRIIATAPGHPDELVDAAEIQIFGHVTGMMRHL